jgi:hypothetical protein
MTFWAFLDKRWPSERAWVTMATFGLAASMLKMAEVEPSLWDVELFKTLLTLVIGSGFVNMILAFHFTANKSDEAKTANTGAAFRAIEETAKSAQGDGAEARGAQDAADAAQHEADTKKPGKPDDPDGAKS